MTTRYTLGAEETIDQLTRDTGSAPSRTLQVVFRTGCTTDEAIKALTKLMQALRQRQSNGLAP